MEPSPICILIYQMEMIIPALRIIWNRRLKSECMAYRRHFKMEIIYLLFIYLGTGVWTPVAPGATPPALFVLSIFKEGFSSYLPGLASNLDPLDLCLLSSKDYRSELPAPG
jgi:hypothetical protein